MHASKEKVKKLFQINSLDPGEAGQQALALRIGEKHCCFAITDITGGNLFQLAYYSADEIEEGSLINLFVNHPELNNSFAKVLVSYDFAQSVLIPEPHFQPEDAGLLVKVMYGVNDGAIVVSHSLAEKQFYNVFAVPKEINEWVNRKLPSAKYFHNYSIGIQNINPESNLWVDFRNDELSLIVAKKNKLLLAQTFAYSTPEDVIYYLLKTAQQFSLSQKEVKLAVSGLIEQESALYKELYQYFLYLKFRNANWEITGSNEYPAHFFTSLNDLARCVS